MKRTKAEIEKVCMQVSADLAKFFGEVYHNLEWSSSRSGKLGVIISYTDFLSEHLLRNMLDDVVPGEIHYVLKREYSDASISRILLEEYKKNRIAVVDCYGGSLVTEPVRMFVNRKLSQMEML